MAETVVLSGPFSGSGEGAGGGVVRPGGALARSAVLCARLGLVTLVACEGVAPASATPPPAVAGATGQAPALPPDARPLEATTKAAADADDAEKDIYKVPIGKSPTRGNPAALVTIVEFADFQCPYCLRGAETLRALEAEYGDKVRIVFKNEPLGFHEGAEPAAEAALEVRDEKGDAAFWAMHDLLLAHQRDLGTEDVIKMAVSLGARADLVRTAIEKHTHQAELDADQELADDLQAEGTPHFFVNGQRLPGAQPKENFETVIDAQMQRARAKLQAGTPPAQLYEALTKDGKGPPEPDRVAVAAIPADDPARGPASARVTVHEFGDFQCPYCAVAEQTVRHLASAYGDKVRIVWHDLPLSFHEHAVGAARAAREARRQGGEAAFWKLHDKMMENPRRVSRADLDEDAKAMGLDMKRWKTALDGDAYADALEADRRAAVALGLEGTPSFIVVGAGAAQGYVLMGAQPYARFRKLVERALAEKP
jgi:protein-disulfide isomerase